MLGLLCLDDDIPIPCALIVQIRLRPVHTPPKSSLPAAIGSGPERLNTRTEHLKRQRHCELLECPMAEFLEREIVSHAHLQFHPNGIIADAPGWGALRDRSRLWTDVADASKVV